MCRVVLLRVWSELKMWVCFSKMQLKNVLLWQIVHIMKDGSTFRMEDGNSRLGWPCRQWIVISRRLLSNRQTFASTGQCTLVQSMRRVRHRQTTSLFLPHALNWLDDAIYKPTSFPRKTLKKTDESCIEAFQTSAMPHSFSTEGINLIHDFLPEPNLVTSLGS